MFTTRRGALAMGIGLGLIVIVGLVAFGLGAFGSAGSPTPTASQTPTGTLPSQTPIVVTKIVTLAGTPTETATGEPPTATLEPTLAASATQAATAITTATATPPTVQLGGTDELGPFLVDAGGMTLYTFGNDTEGNSTCTGSCAATWPPLTVAPGTALVAGGGVTGQLATITRDDGALQVTYNGHPLYHYRGDTAPGDTKGQGYAGLWFVAAP